MFLLGGFRVERADGAAVAISRRKSQALLALLALRPTHSYAREELTALLWADSTDEQARHSLRQALHELRGTLARTKVPVLSVDGDRVALDADAIDIDVAQFERLAGENAPGALERAAALYAGDLLLGLTVPDEEFEQRLRDERERLRQRALGVLTRLLDHQVKAQRSEPAIETALRLLAMDPTHEPVHGTLMRLYARVGQRAAAFKQYQVCVDVLQRELDVAPEPATKALYQEALAHLGPAPGAAMPSEPPPDSGRFIGRQRELGLLQQAFEAARGGRGRLVTILGEAGIGKTRLIHELASRIGRQGGQLIVGRCFESEEVLPFAPWIDILRGEAARGALAEVAGAYPRHRTQLARLLPELGGERPGAPAPAEDYRRIFEAVAHVVGSIAARRPTAIVVDDLHWADDMSVRLLAFLARRRGTGRLLVVASAREEELHERPLARRLLNEAEGAAPEPALSVGPLSEAETLALARELAAGPSRPDSERVAKRVWRLSEGNPFMVVETIRALRGGATPDTGDRLPLSQRIQQMVLRRLERLGRRSQTLVAVAAVIGREFDYALLPRAAQVSERAAAEGVEELVRHRVLQSAGERLAFAHDYFREVAYARILPPRRRLLHGAVARAIETLYRHDLDPHAAALGRHYREAAFPAEAVPHLRRAAAVASSRGDHGDAVGHLEQTLAVLEELPRQRATLEQAIDVRFELSNCFSALGQFAQQGEWADAAARAAEALGDQPRLAWASTYLSHYHWVMGRSREACAHAERALAAAEADGDVPLIVNARKSIGLALEMMGKHTQAAAHFERCIELLTGDLVRHPCGLPLLPAITSRAWLALTLAERGQFDLATARGHEALRLADELDHSPSGSIAYWCVGRVYQIKGVGDTAMTLLQRSLALAEEGSFKIMLPLVKVSLGLRQAESGRIAEGLALVDEGLDVFEPGNALHAYAMRNLGEIYLRAGRRDDAKAAWTQALALARQSEQRATEAGVLFLLGNLAAEDDAAALAAADYYRQAMTIAQELDARSLQARCHLGLGMLLQDETHLAAGTALFREMGLEMPLIPAEAAPARRARG